MYHTRALGSGQKQASRLARQLRRGLATAPDAADVVQARKYCLNQLKCVLFSRLSAPSSSLSSCVSNTLLTAS